MPRIGARLRQLVKEVITGDAARLNQRLYASDDFPFWFSVHALWSAFLVSLSYLRGSSDETKRLIKGISIAALLAFGAREVLALWTAAPSPALAHPSEFVIFGIAVAAFEFAALADRVRRFLFGLISAVEGVNRFRLFLYAGTRLGGDPIAKAAIGLALAVFDQAAEVGLRAVLGGAETALCTKRTALATVAVLALHWAVAFVGIVPAKFGAIVDLAAGIGLGALNAKLVIDGDPAQYRGKRPAK
jgi:hypothetical protein